VRVVIDNATLRRHRSCKGAYTNREWDADAQALIFSDWAASVTELLSTPKGLARLEWYVHHGLVPMTKDEFISAKSGVSNE
jgi:hypothetical protein